MNILGLIPARGGSKGVKGKNIRPVDGKPLIRYSIEAARESTLLHHYVVDTDDALIAQAAGDAGATVLMRPPGLALDHSSVVDVALRVLDLFEQEGVAYDILVLLQPTSPIRTGSNIDEAIRLMLDDDSCEGVISVVPMEDTHPARMYNLDKTGNLVALHPELETRRRQELEPVYYRNGCIYVIRAEALKAQRTFMPAAKKGYVMPSAWLANIDDERDLIITEALVKAWKEGRI